MSPRRRAPEPPLPVRDGLGPVRIRLHDGGRVVDELVARFGPAAVDQVDRGEVVDSAGMRVTAGTRLPAGAVVYTYREPAEEISVPLPSMYCIGTRMSWWSTSRIFLPPCRVGAT